jgi:hypothetical protein
MKITPQDRPSTIVVKTKSKAQINMPADWWNAGSKA